MQPLNLSTPASEYNVWLLCKFGVRVEVTHSPTRSPSISHMVGDSVGICWPRTWTVCGLLGGCVPPGGLATADGARPTEATDNASPARTATFRAGVFMEGSVPFSGTVLMAVVSAQCRPLPDGSHRHLCLFV